MIIPGKILAPFVLIACIFIGTKCFCQPKTIPDIVASNFASMYPTAKNVEWKDKLNDFQVFFLIDNTKCEAKFNNDGKWISTEKKIKMNSLPALIKMNMWLSKYSNWQILSAFVIDSNYQKKEFHVVVTNGELPKRILFFDQNGQLLRDNMSL